MEKNLRIQLQELLFSSCPNFKIPFGLILVDYLIFGFFHSDIGTANDPQNYLSSVDIHNRGELS